MKKMCVTCIWTVQIISHIKLPLVVARLIIYRNENGSCVDKSVAYHRNVSNVFVDDVYECETWSLLKKLSPFV